MAGGLAPAAIYSLGEAIFAYIDELSAESAEGYAEEQSVAAGESERRRRRLVRLLAQDPPAGQEAVRTAAVAATWALPRGGSPRSWPGPRADGQPGEAHLDSLAARLARRLGEGAIGAEAGGAAVVFVPDPDAPGRRRRLDAAVRDRAAALGPTVAWPEALASVRRAVATLPARRRRAGWARTPPTVSSSPTSTSPTCCSPPTPRSPPTSPRPGSRRSTTLADGPRARLRETLAAWLDRPGQVQAVAAALEVHPQTVRYRVRQLRDLFGDRLEDPDARFELSLALRSDDANPRCYHLSPMRLLLTGAAGMLGRDLAAAAERAGHDVHALARGDLDIRDAAAVRAAVAAAAPDAVVNCAAWTDVDGAEADEAAATRLNGAAAGHVAAAAAAAGAFTVQVSTDYVFDGTGDRAVHGVGGDRAARRLRAVQARGRARRRRGRARARTRSSAPPGCSAATAATSSPPCCGSPPSATP